MPIKENKIELAIEELVKLIDKRKENGFLYLRIEGQLIDKNILELQGLGFQVGLQFKLPKEGLMKDAWTSISWK